MDVIGGKALAWAVNSLYFKRNDNEEALTGAPRQNNGLISLFLKIYRKSVEKRFNAFREIEGNQE
ncbi:22891_t:CDS:1, partial [Gigaspora margarita]